MKFKFPWQNDEGGKTKVILLTIGKCLNQWLEIKSINTTPDTHRTYLSSLKVLKRFGMFISFGQSSGVPSEFKLSDLLSNGSLYAQRPSLGDYIKSRKELEEVSGNLFQMIVNGKIKIDGNSCAFIKQLSDLHLDNLNTISFTDGAIINSISFLESFILFHVDGLKKVQSMDFVHKLLNK